MRVIKVISNVVTTFSKGGALDEAAYRAHLERMASAGIGIFTGSPGSGEVHTLTRAEFRRTCEIAVEVGRGRVPVCSMTPELHNIEEIIEWGEIGASTGVDEVQFFQYMGGHGMLPKREEQHNYWRRVLDALDHPVALSFHIVAGYLGEPDLARELCAEYPHVKTVYQYGGSLKQMMALRDALPEGVKLGGHLGRALPELALGVDVFTAAEPNVIPRTCRALVDSYLAGDVARLEVVNERFSQMAHSYEKWGLPNFRWLKMALTVLDLPGGGSDLRPPIIYPPKEEFNEMAAIFEKLGVRPWEAE